MKKGHSYLYLDDSNINHPLIKKLKGKGINCIELIYVSRYSTEAGWKMVNSDKVNIGFGGWLGFTIKSSLINIDNLIVKEDKYLYYERNT